MTKNTAISEEAAFRAQLAASSTPPTLAQARRLVELQAKARGVAPARISSGAQKIAAHLERTTPMSEATAPQRLQGMRPNYEHVHASEVPGAVRFDVPEAFQGKAVEVAFGGDPRAEQPHGEGAPFKRVRNTVTKRPADFFRLAGLADDAAKAWKATKAADAKRGVSVDTGEYERSHGAKPRGRGGWMFVFATSREQLEAKQRANNYLDFVWTAKDADGYASLLFGEAVKAAKAEARRRGANWVGVCS